MLVVPMYEIHLKLRKVHIRYFPVVSPAYGFIALALVKCSNNGGPGPRHNMKEDPGSSIFSMLVVGGCYLYLLPLFSESGD